MSDENTNDQESINNITEDYKEKIIESDEPSEKNEKDEQEKSFFDEKNPYDLQNDNDNDSNKINEENSKQDSDTNESKNISGSNSNENKKIEINNEDFNKENPYEIKNIDEDDISISSDVEKNITIPNSIENQNDQVQNDKSLFEQRPFLEKYRFSLISSGITFVIIMINIILATAVKSKVRMHIIPKTLEIVNKIGGYIIWSVHCIGLILLPFLVVNLFEKRTKMYQIFFPPFMMLCNLIGGIIPIKWSCFPLIIELLLTIFLIFHLPFDSVYIPKTKKFWPGEIILMLLGFIYISSALGASTLSYMMYGSFIRVNKFFSTYPSNPHYAIEYIKYLKSNPEYNIMGEYLACYSLFTFLSVGIGFVMSLKNSILMIVPFLILSICTVIETKAVGTLLFCQLLIHVIYITGLHFKKTRYLESGSCWDCLTNLNYVSIMTVIIGDIAIFFLVVFPILHLMIYKDGNKKFHWGYYIAGAIVMTIAMCFNFSAADEDGCFIFLSPIAYLGATCIFGMLFAGYIPFIRLFTYQITYLTWSCYLFFWCFSQGYSPTLLKVYNFLIPIASCVMIELYEGIGWMEIVCAVIQIPIDTFIIYFLADGDCGLMLWPMFSISGLLILSGLIAIPVIIGGIILILCFGCMVSNVDKIGESVGKMFENTSNNNNNQQNNPVYVNTYVPEDVKRQAGIYAAEHNLSCGTTFNYNGYSLTVQ